MTEPAAPTVAEAREAVVEWAYSLSHPAQGEDLERDTDALIESVRSEANAEHATWTAEAFQGGWREVRDQERERYRALEEALSEIVVATNADLPRGNTSGYVTPGQQANAIARAALEALDEAYAAPEVKL